VLARATIAKPNSWWHL